MSDPPRYGGERPPPPPPPPPQPRSDEPTASPVALDDFDPSVPVLDLEGSDPISLPEVSSEASGSSSVDERGAPLFDLASTVDHQDRTMLAEAPTGPSRGTLGQLKLPPPGKKVVPRIIDEVDTGRIIARAADDLAGDGPAPHPDLGTADDEPPTLINHRASPPGPPPPPPFGHEEPYFEPEPPHETTAERRRSAEALVREVLSSSGQSPQMGPTPSRPPPPPVPRHDVVAARPTERRGSRKIVFVVLGLTLLALGALAAYQFVLVPRQVRAQAGAESEVAAGAGESEAKAEPEASANPEAAAEVAPTPDPVPEPEPVSDTADPVPAVGDTESGDTSEDAPIADVDDAAGEPSGDAEPTGPAADETLAEARQLLEKKPQRSYDLAQQSFEAKPTKAALLLMVRAGCAMGSAKKAKEAYVKLPLSSREDVRAECEARGLNIGI